MPISVDRLDVQRLVAGGARLVEVLPSEEFAGEHLPGALHIPLTHLDRTAVDGFDRTAPIVVYCWDAR